jgi:hypothetical protein
MSVRTWVLFVAAGGAAGGAFARQGQVSLPAIIRA